METGKAKRCLELRKHVKTSDRSNDEHNPKETLKSLNDYKTVDKDYRAVDKDYRTVDKRLVLDRKDRQQKENLIVMKKILEHFNIEDTKQKYETQNVVEYMLDPNEFGYDCSPSTIRVRQRLCELMGSDVIRLNDKRYFQKLSDRLQEEYETHISKQEEARAASEQERLHRLMLEGVIDDMNDCRAIVYDHNKIKSQKNTKRKISYNNVTQEINIVRPASEIHTKSRKEGVSTHMNIMSGYRPAMSNMSNFLCDNGDQINSSRQNVVADDNEKKQKTKNVKDMHANPRLHKRAVLRPISAHPSRDARRVKSATPCQSRIEKDSPTCNDAADYFMNLHDKGYIRKPSRFAKQEPARIAKLRNEETVHGLYSIAEYLVCHRMDDSSDKKERSHFRITRETVKV